VRRALQFLTADDFPGMSDKDGQQLERLALQLDAKSKLPQLPGSKVGFKHTKTDSAGVGRGLSEHGTTTEYHNQSAARKDRGARKTGYGRHRGTLAERQRESRYACATWDSEAGK
jgi:hypothetical protein